MSPNLSKLIPEKMLKDAMSTGVFNTSATGKGGKSSKGISTN